MSELWGYLFWVLNGGVYEDVVGFEVWMFVGRECVFV